MKIYLVQHAESKTEEDDGGACRARHRGERGSGETGGGYATARGDHRKQLAGGPHRTASRGWLLEGMDTRHEGS